MENPRLLEVWKTWAQCYLTTKDISERIVAHDVLDIIRDLVMEKATNACLNDATLEPEQALKDILAEIGIKRREFIKTE